MRTLRWPFTAVVKTSVELGRNGRVAVDDLGGDAAHGLDAEGERGHVEQQLILNVPGEDAGPARPREGDHFLRV